MKTEWQLVSSGWWVDSLTDEDGQQTRVITEASAACRHLHTQTHRHTHTPTHKDLHTLSVEWEHNGSYITVVPVTGILLLKRRGVLVIHVSSDMLCPAGPFLLLPVLLLILLPVLLLPILLVEELQSRGRWTRDFKDRGGGVIWACMLQCNYW